MQLPSEPNFQSSIFFAEHISDTLNFYEPRAIAAKGGFNRLIIEKHR